uniref:VOC family protein n=1 Tax=Thaumasiovibrio occultus TaxID=1891184 RepID=UPI000B36485E|nr:VOC family protein [Thaumasiovibrio occultus]
MSQLRPYLFFSGACEQALVFYTECFGGEVVSKMYFSEAPTPMEGANPDWVMHAEFKGPDFSLLMSDGMFPASAEGSNMALCLELTDTAIQTQWFDALAQEGVVIMPLADTFWGARFGQVRDKFGVRWMLHCTLSN